MRDNKEYLNAADVVCIGCNYLSEKTCEKCPVRKTCDDIYKKKELNNE